MKITQRVKDIAYFSVIVLLVLVMVLSGLRILESTLLRTKVGEETFESKTVYRGETAYFPRQDITTVLVLVRIGTTSTMCLPTRHLRN